jgi:hypothetical protein
MAKLFKLLIIVLGAGGLYGLLLLFGVFQSSPVSVWGHGVSWATMTCGLFSLVAALKIKV